MLVSNRQQSLTWFSVRDARFEELASASKDILAQCALKCSAIGENELRERENLRYALAVAKIPRHAGATYAHTYACARTLMSAESLYGCVIWFALGMLIMASQAGKSLRAYGCSTRASA